MFEDSKGRDQIVSGNISGWDEGRQQSSLQNVGLGWVPALSEWGHLAIRSRSLKLLPNRGPFPNSCLAACHSKSKYLRDKWDREGRCIQEASNLGRWQTNVQRPSLSVQGKLECFKGKAWEMGLHAGEAHAQQWVICPHDPERTCWWQWWVVSKKTRTYLLGKSGPLFLKPRGPQNLKGNKWVLLQTVGLRSTNKECLSLKQVNLHLQCCQKTKITDIEVKPTAHLGLPRMTS